MAESAGCGIAAGDVDHFAVENLAGQLVEAQSDLLTGPDAFDVGVFDDEDGRWLLRIADETDERAGLDECAAILLVEDRAGPLAKSAVGGLGGFDARHGDHFAGDGGG